MKNAKGGGRTGSGNGRANPLPVPLVQFRREKGCKKNEDAKGTKGRQQECPLSRGCSTPVQIRPGKWTARGAASLPRTVSHRATKVTDPLFPCAVLYRVFRTSSPRNGRPPLHGRIERASMPTFFSTILRSLSRFPSFDRSPLLTAVGESCSWLVKGQRDNFTIIAYR